MRDDAVTFRKLYAGDDPERSWARSDGHVTATVNNAAVRRSKDIAGFKNLLKVME